MRPASAPGPGDRKNRLWPKCRRIAKFWARKGVRQHTKYKPYQRAWGLAKIRYSRQYRAAQTAKFVQSLRDRGWAVARIAGYLKCSAGKVYRLLKVNWLAKIVQAKDHLRYALGVWTSGCRVRCIASDPRRAHGLPHLLKAFRAEAREAQRDPSNLAKFKALRLNMGVSDVVVLYLVTPDEWLAVEDEVTTSANKRGPCIWGIDLGQTAAMSAVAAYWPETGRLDAIAAFPNDPPLGVRERFDGVKPGLYQNMADRAELLLLGDKVVHIIKVYRFFEAHGTAYIVMEYAEGETLSTHLERKGSLSEAELKAILYPLLDGLAVVHGADFLHRDIKPGNIVLRDVDGSPVLLDFGAARQAIGAKSRSVTSIVTPGYAPIEQYSSRGRQGAWTDIYALGGVCYRALTGQVPEDATDRMRDDPLVPVSQQCAGRASASFLSAVDWALSVDEGDRPQGVGAWRAAMEVDMVTAAEKAAADDAASAREVVQGAAEQERASDSAARAASEIVPVSYAVNPQSTESGVMRFVISSVFATVVVVPVLSVAYLGFALGVQGIRWDAVAVFKLSFLVAITVIPALVSIVVSLFLACWTGWMLKGEGGDVIWAWIRFYFWAGVYFFVGKVILIKAFWFYADTRVELPFWTEVHYFLLEIAIYVVEGIGWGAFRVV